MRFFATLLMMTCVLPSLAAGKKERPTGRILDLKYNFKEAGVEMPYSLYLPKAYTAKKKWPLVVALHGLFSNPWQMIRYPGLTTQAEKYGFIVVAPMGYNSVGWYGSKGQKSDLFVPKNLGELSEKDVLNVVANTQKEFPVDTRNIFLMGHSMGGATVAQYALAHQDRLKSLTLLNSAPLKGRDLPKGWDEPIREQFRSGALPQGDMGFQAPHVTEEFKSYVLEDIGRNPIERALAGRPSMSRLRLRERLSEIKVPTLVAGGDRDDTGGIDNILADYLALPEENRSLHIYHGIGHSPNVEVPESFVGLLVRFISEARVTQDGPVHISL